MDDRTGERAQSATYFERSDANLPALGLVAIGVATAITASALILWAWASPLARFERPVKPPDLPRPSLQIDAQKDLQRFLQKQRRALDVLEWIDRAKGIARIPVRAAMKQIVRTGLPDWPANSAGGKTR
jgi:hypothetical protein